MSRAFFNSGQGFFGAVLFDHNAAEFVQDHRRAAGSLARRAGIRWRPPRCGPWRASGRRDACGCARWRIESRAARPTSSSSRWSFLTLAGARGVPSMGFKPLALRKPSTWFQRRRRPCRRLFPWPRASVCLEGGEQLAHAGFALALIDKIDRGSGFGVGQLDLFRRVQMDQRRLHFFKADELIFLQRLHQQGLIGRCQIILCASLAGAGLRQRVS